MRQNGTKEKYDRMKEKYDRTEEEYDRTKEKYDRMKEKYHGTEEKYQSYSNDTVCLQGYKSLYYYKEFYVYFLHSLCI